MGCRNYIVFTNCVYICLQARSLRDHIHQEAYFIIYSPLKWKNKTILSSSSNFCRKFERYTRESISYYLWNGDLLSKKRYF